MTYNIFYVFFADGSSTKAVYPEHWTLQDVMKAEGSDDVMGPYPEEE